MNLEKDRGSPPMKFQLGEKISFIFGNKMLIGTIDIRDFGGSIEHGYYSSQRRKHAIQTHSRA